MVRYSTVGLGTVQDITLEHLLQVAEAVKDKSTVVERHRAPSPEPCRPIAVRDNGNVEVVKFRVLPWICAQNSASPVLRWGSHLWENTESQGEIGTMQSAARMKGACSHQRAAQKHLWET